MHGVYGLAARTPTRVSPLCLASATTRCRTAPNGAKPRCVLWLACCSASDIYHQAAEQEYILNAYEEDVEMRDSEAEEADVENELDGKPGILEFLPNLTLLNLTFRTR